MDPGIGVIKGLYLGSFIFPGDTCAMPGLMHHIGDMEKLATQALPWLCPAMATAFITLWGGGVILMLLP